MYNGRTPRGKEKMILHHPIVSNNDDLKTLCHGFDGKCIEEGEDAFQEYPNDQKNQLSSQTMTLSNSRMMKYLINILSI
jgi:hypothetical protein